MAYAECVQDAVTGMKRYVTRSGIFGECKVQQISPFTHRPVCFTTEALKYSQTSFFFGVVATQINNALTVKTRKLSLLYQGMKNQFMLFGFASEICVSLILAYCFGINVVFGTRDTIFIHFGIAALPFGIFENLWD